MEVQVLRLCALYLTKDPIYDYRGDVKTGTFMGDYMGKSRNHQGEVTGRKEFSLAPPRACRRGQPRRRDRRLYRLHKLQSPTTIARTPR